jgi:protein-S-isoprenylcysteine O-methyltransferase
MSPERLVPIALVIAMAAMELYAGRLRRAGVRSRDLGSLLVLYVLIAVGYWTAFQLWSTGRAPGPRLGVGSAWAGAVVGAGGLGLRLWSVIALGQYFTYVVKVTPDQKVVDTGPYRLIRHPSYTGSLLLGIGIGLSMGYVSTAALIGLTSLAGFLFRLFVEERALAETIGEPYRAYMARTKRLVPFIW